MAAFCGKCGSPLISQAVFCGACGAAVPAAGSPMPPTAAAAKPAPSQATAYTPVSAAPPMPPAAAGKSSSPLLKLAVAFVVIIFVGGVAALAAVYYAAHRVSEKVHEVERKTLGSDHVVTASSIGSLLSGAKNDASATSADDHDASVPSGDLCRFLTLADVSRATGTQVIRAEPNDAGCAYIAHGDPADATTKHLGGLVAQKGGTDAKTQEMVQKFAGAFFKQQEEGDKDLEAQAKTGEISVIAINFSSGHAVAEMKLNHKVMGRIGAQTDITGIGDEAFDSADGILHVRKGNTMFRLIYVSCPCATDAVKPLALKVAAAL